MEQVRGKHTRAPRHLRATSLWTEKRGGFNLRQDACLLFVPNFFIGLKYTYIQLRKSKVYIQLNGFVQAEYAHGTSTQIEKQHVSSTQKPPGDPFTGRSAALTSLLTPNPIGCLRRLPTSAQGEPRRACSLGSAFFCSILHVRDSLIRGVTALTVGSLPPCGSVTAFSPIPPWMDTRVGSSSWLS